MEKLVLLYDLTFAFKAQTCLHPAKWLGMVIIRAGIFTLFYFHSDQFFTYFEMNRSETIGAAFYDLFLIVPVCLFVLWYFFTTLLMFLGALYGGFGNSNIDNTPVETEYNEIQKFLDWRNNKMKFSSYEQSMQLMRDTAILNNLQADENDPEVKKTLDFLSNKMKFMSYTETLDFLRGK